MKRKIHRLAVVSAVAPLAFALPIHGDLNSLTMALAKRWGGNGVGNGGDNGSGNGATGEAMAAETLVAKEAGRTRALEISNPVLREEALTDAIAALEGSFNRQLTDAQENDALLDSN